MGGNIFKDRATSIKAQDIEPTIQAYREFLSSVFPQKSESFKFFEPVGSAGKKPVSGDLDLAIDKGHIVESFTASEIEKWGIEWDNWNTLYTKIHKRARTATQEMSKMKALLTLIAEKLKAKGIPVGDRVTAGNIFAASLNTDRMLAQRETWFRLTGWSETSIGSGGLTILQNIQPSKDYTEPSS